MLSTDLSWSVAKLITRSGRSRHLQISQSCGLTDSDRLDNWYFHYSADIDIELAQSEPSLTDVIDLVIVVMLAVDVVVVLVADVVTTGPPPLPTESPIDPLINPTITSSTIDCTNRLKAKSLTND